MVEEINTVVSNNSSSEFTPDLIASNEFGPPTLANLADQYGTDVSLEDQRAIFRRQIDVKQLTREGFTEEQIARYLVEKFPTPGGKQLSYEKAFLGNQNDNNKVIQFIMDEPETSYAEQFGVGINKGLMSVGVPASAAAYAGIKTAGAATALAAPLGPFAPLVGIGTGIAVGATTYYSLSKLGLQTSELILPESEYVSSQPQYFPTQEAGLMGGSNIPFVAGPWQLQKYFLNPGKITYGNLVAKQQRVAKGSKEIITPFETMALSAKDNSFKAGFFELSTVGGVSVGSYIAEENDPGNYPKKLGLELLYGVLAPTGTAVVGNLAGDFGTLGRRIFNIFRSGKAQEMLNTKQGQWLRDNIEGSGSDWENILDKLNDPELTKLLAEGQNIDRKLPLNQQFRKTGTVDESYFGPTVAAITEDPFLIALESTLAKESPNFRREAAASYSKGITGLHNLVKLMEQSGDPLLVSKAAKMEAEIYRTMIERRLLTAQENAEATVNKVIGPEKQSKLDEIISKSDLDSTDPKPLLPPESNLGLLQAKAGVVTNEITENALKDIRKQEKGFYDLVDGQEPVVPNSFIETVAKILREEGDDADQFIPSNVMNLYNRAIGKDTEMVSKEAANLSALREKINKQEMDIADYEVINQDTAKLINDFDATLNRSDLTDESILAAYQAEKARIEGISLTKEFTSPQKKRAINLLNKNLTVLNNRLNLKGLNAAVTQEVDLGQEATEVLLSDLINLRSNLLTKARSASSSGNWQPAHFMSDIADGIRQDFEVATGPGLSSLSDANKKVLQDAWTFSREFNNAFSRAAPVAKTLKRTSKGALALAPELAFKSLMTGGGDASALKFKQMRNAMTFLSEQLGKDFEATDFARLGTMKAGQETMLSFMFEKVVDPITNLVDPSKLAAFKKENRNVLSMFPLLKKDLRDIDSANAVLAKEQINYQKGLDVLNKPTTAKGEDALIAFSNQDNLPEIIGNVIGDPGSRGKNPDATLIDYSKRIKLAANQKKFKGIEDGFLNTILDSATNYSTTPPPKGGEAYFNPQSFKQYMMEPILKNRDSVLTILRKQKIITRGQEIRLSEIIENMIKFEKQEKNLLSQETPVVKQGIVPETGRMLGVAATVASVGTYNWMRGLIGLKSLGAGGIAVPAAIAGAAQQYVKIPAIMTIDVIERAMKDPEFFKLITSQTKSEKEILNFRLKFGNAMYKGGSLRTLTEEQRLEEERRIKRDLLQLEQDRVKKIITQKQGYDIEELKRRARPEATETQEKLRTSFLTRQLEQQPQSGNPPTNNFASSASGSGNAGTGFKQMSQEQKYAALFPNDASGIGSLMS